MKATKSKMSKQFSEHRERGLRCMADGGLVGNRMQRMEQIAGATAPVTLSANPGLPQPAPVQPVAAPQPVQPMTPEEAEWQRIKAEKLAPKPTIMSKVKKTFGFANGGTLRAINATMPKIDPNAAKVRTITSGTIGIRGADGGDTKDMIKRTGLRGALRYAEVHEGPGKVKGRIKGKDSVNAKLMPDEYVLPVDTVEAVGKENLDALVAQTHTRRPESETMMPGDEDMPRAADGDPGLRYRRFTPNAGPQTPYGAAPAQPAYNTRPPLTSVSKEAAQFVQSQDASRATRAATSAAPPAAGASWRTPQAGLRGMMGVPGYLGGSGIVSAARTFNTPTSEYARRFGTDEPTGFLEDVGARSLGALQDLGNTITWGGADRLGNFLSNGSFDHSSAYNAPVQPAATSVPQSQPTAAAAATMRTPGTASPVAAPQTLRNNGLTVSTSGDMSRNRVGPNGEIFGPGSEPITAGEQVVDSQGNVMRPGSISITGDGGPEPVGMQTRAGREAQLRAAYAPTQYEGRPGQSTNSLVAEANPIGAPQLPAGSIGEQFDRDVAAKRGLRTQRLQMELNQRERDSMRQYGAAAERNAVTLRGQDMTAKTAGEAAVRDQANKDRQFKLDVAKYGTDVAEKNRAAASASDEALQKNLESRFRTKDKDGKDVVDTGKIASFRTAVSATMPRLIEQLEATKNPAAIAKAQQLRQRGTAALEPGDWDNLQQWHDIRDRMRASKGMGPNKASMAESDNLLDFKQTGVEHRTFGGNRVVTPAGSISYNDLRYTEPANAILPDWFKTENRNLTRGLRSDFMQPNGPRKPMGKVTLPNGRVVDLDNVPDENIMY